MPLGEYVYRAVTDEKQQITRAREPKWQLFRRRSELKDDGSGEKRDNWDPAGLSFGLTPEDAVRHAGKNYGVAKVSVKGIKDRGYKFDTPSDGHVNLVDFPFYSQATRDEAMLAAGHLIECVEEILPPMELTTE